MGESENQGQENGGKEQLLTDPGGGRGAYGRRKKIGTKKGGLKERTVARKVVWRRDQGRDCGVRAVAKPILFSYVSVY